MENKNITEEMENESEVVSAEMEETAANSDEIAVEETVDTAEQENVSSTTEDSLADSIDDKGTAEPHPLGDKYIIQQPSKIDPNKKKFYKKWWFWVIIVLAVGIISIGAIAIADSSSSSGSSSSSYVPSVSPYVSMVKNAEHSQYGVTYARAFESFFSNTRWSHFVATSGQHVVEFEGGFYYDNSPATAKIQFVIDVSAGTFTAYHLSINGVAQSRLMLAALIQKAFESVTSYY